MSKNLEIIIVDSKERLSFNLSEADEKIGQIIQNKKGSNLVMLLPNEFNTVEIFNIGKKWGKALGNLYFVQGEDVLPLSKLPQYKECCILCKEYQKNKKCPSREDIDNLDAYSCYILGRLCWDLE